MNWNQVCNGGLLIGALAIAETDPNYARTIVSAAIASLPNAMRRYEPDGAWMEGPVYWNYATRYTVFGLAALDTALGKDFGLSKIKGLSEAGLFPIYANGPTKLFLNYADAATNPKSPMPCMFWLAQTFNNRLFADFEHDTLSEHTASPEHIIWYVPLSKVKPPQKDLDRYFRGPVEVAVFRSSWDDPQALFVGVKAGFNEVPHAHLDLGNFEIDALGVRWVMDLGLDNYNLPDYFGEKRWTYYRLRSISHNVPILGGRDQDRRAKAKFLKFESKKSSAFVVIDLTSAYKEFAEKTTRGVAIVQNRRAVLVQDEFHIRKPCSAAWGITSSADISIKEKTTAILTIDDKQLIAKVLCPSDAEFTVESAEQEPPQNPNTGISRRMLRLPEAKGYVRIAVLLSPVWDTGAVTSLQELKPLAQW